MTPRRLPVPAVVALLVLAIVPAPSALGQGPSSVPPPGPDGNLPAAGLSWAEELPPAPKPVLVWGVAGLRGYVFGDQIAPNGLEFKALFSLDLDFNVWLWPAQGLYLFVDSRFWGQRAAPGVTNASQGPFDFSKREFDFSTGIAWNYWGSFEARVFAYSYNNLNRGDSAALPSGYTDGVGLENRYYLGATYADLGTEAFDVARASFLSAGYYPAKDLVDSQGHLFRPGPFVRAYLTWDLLGDTLYLYGDVQATATRSFTPKLLTLDAGLAIRPFPAIPRLEFRLGTGETFDLRDHDLETGLYGAVRIVY
jgi:hypothetical protein